jgi:ABC-type branched-subunit amino acid transport system substrate-binding protein
VLYPIFAIILIFNCLQANAEPIPFKFGISAPLSGVLAEYGTAVRNGIALAQEDRAADFRGVELIFEDSQWDPKQAVSVFKLLHEIRKVDLIYSWGNPTSAAIAPIAQRLKVATVAMSSDPQITRNGRYLIRTLRSGEELGQLVAKNFQSRGLKRIGVVVAENSYVQGLYNGFMSEMKRSGATVDLLGRFDPSMQDFKSIVSRIKTGSYDGIGVLLITGQVSSFFRQLQAQAVSLPSFGADFLGSKTEIEAAGSAINGAVFPDLGVTSAFRKRYLQTYGNDIQIAFAANAYDVASLVASTFANSPSGALSSEEVLEKMRKQPSLIGAHGSFVFQEDETNGPAFVSQLVLRKVVDGEIRDLQ